MPEVKEHLYFTDLVNRLLNYINLRVENERKGHVAQRVRFTYGTISRRTGVPYDTIYSLVKRKVLPMTLARMDMLLYGCDMGILDLLRGQEVMTRATGLTRVKRIKQTQHLTKTGEFQKALEIQKNMLDNPEKEA